MWKDALRGFWRRLRQWRLFGGRRHPAWGAQPPVILGVCRSCGAVVLEGWQEKVADGYLCRRCAGHQEQSPAGKAAAPGPGGPNPT